MINPAVSRLKDYGTMTTPHPLYRLLYDGDCPMCGNAVKTLRKLGLLAHAEAVAWQESGIEDEVLAERIRVELLLKDTATNTVTGGFLALTRLMRLTPAYRWLGEVLKFPPLLWLGERVYKTVSLNRRILSPPQTGGMACACDPPFHKGYRTLLFLFLIGLNVLGCFGIHFSFRPDTWHWWLVRILLWNLPFLLVWALGLVFLQRGKATLLGEQIPVLMGWMGLYLIMTDILLRLAEWMRLPHTWFWVICYLLTILGLILSILVMHGLVLRSFIRRAQALALPGWLPWVWLLFALGIQAMTFFTFVLRGAG